MKLHQSKIAANTHPSLDVREISWYQIFCLDSYIYRFNQSQFLDKNQDSFLNQCYTNIHDAWWELLAYLLLSFGDDWKVIELRCQDGRLRWTLNWGYYSNYVCRSPGCWLGGAWPHCSSTGHGVFSWHISPWSGPVLRTGDHSHSNPDWSGSEAVCCCNTVKLLGWWRGVEWS